MTQTESLLKELVVLTRENTSELKKFNSNFVNYVDAKTAIKLLGRSRPREMKYIRERFLTDPGDCKKKNGCTYEYQVKSLVELKTKIDCGRVQLP